MWRCSAWGAVRSRYVVARRSPRAVRLALGECEVVIVHQPHHLSQHTGATVAAFTLGLASVGAPVAATRTLDRRHISRVRFCAGPDPRTRERRVAGELPWHGI